MIPQATWPDLWEALSYGHSWWSQGVRLSTKEVCGKNKRDAYAIFRQQNDGILPNDTSTPACAGDMRKVTDSAAECDADLRSPFQRAQLYRALVLYHNCCHVTTAGGIQPHQHTLFLHISPSP